MDPLHYQVLQEHHTIHLSEPWCLSSQSAVQLSESVKPLRGVGEKLCRMRDLHLGLVTYGDGASPCAACLTAVA